MTRSTPCSRAVASGDARGAACSQGAQRSSRYLRPGLLGFRIKFYSFSVGENILAERQNTGGAIITDCEPCGSRKDPASSSWRALSRATAAPRAGPVPVHLIDLSEEGLHRALIDAPQVVHVPRRAVADAVNHSLHLVLRVLVQSIRKWWVYIPSGGFLWHSSGSRNDRAMPNASL